MLYREIMAFIILMRSIPLCFVILIGCKSSINTTNFLYWYVLYSVVTTCFGSSWSRHQVIGTGLTVMKYFLISSTVNPVPMT
jgi:hypothetical protein